MITQNELTNCNFRIDKKTKQQAEVLFDEMGLNMSTALNMFLKQAVRENRIPFEISLETQRYTKQEMDVLINEALDDIANGDKGIDGDVFFEQLKAKYKEF